MFVNSWLKLPVMLIESKLLLIHENAISTLSFMTYPNCPVTWIFCLLFLYWIASTVNTFPPIGDQASPFTTPMPPHNSCSYLLSRYYSTLSFVIIYLVPFLTTFLQILAIFLSKVRTPISLVYLITYRIPSVLNSTRSSAPFSFSWLGIKWFTAIYNFYYLVYPGTSISSSLFRRGPDNSREFAVHINITFERSTGKPT